MSLQQLQSCFFYAAILNAAILKTRAIIFLLTVDTFQSDICRATNFSS